MGRREILLALAGFFLFVLAVWRQNQLAEWSQDPSRKPALVRTLAPRFTLADHRRNVVKLERLLGRHRVVLVFFDSDLGVDQDPRTKPLIKANELLEQNDIKVIAVGTATPFANEEAEKRLGQKIPFPVLTDIELNAPLPSPAHRLYGLIDPETGETRSGLFLIERDGTVPFSPQGDPLIEVNEKSVLDSLAKGEWPKQ